MTTSVLNEKNQYLSQFEQLERELGDRDPPWLRRIRKAAIARFAELGFPTARNEDWKFTNLASLTKALFQTFTRDELEHLYRGFAMRTPEDLEDLDAYQIGFLNGHYAEALSTFEFSILTPPTGLILESLPQALMKDAARVQANLARHAKYDEHSFVALNTASLRDGAFICVPRGTVLNKPLHLLFVSTTPDGPIATHPRSLVVVGENTQVTIVETYVGQGDYFTNAIVEIVAGENAIIDHYKVQRESKDAYHIATTAVHQAKGSNFRTHYIGLGGKLVRNEVHVRFDGEGAEATVNGLYLASGNQHMDNFTVIDHAKPHCDSHELYKGILDGKAHGVFNGKIFVRPDAQKTDAKQTNQTLLLSEDAVINTKPQLEIFADDVKCTHGATVGQLDPNQLFYLRARGLGLEEARNLLTFAFANDIIGRIQVEPLRKQLEGLLMTHQHLGKE